MLPNLHRHLLDGRICNVWANAECDRPVWKQEALRWTKRVLLARGETKNKEQVWDLVCLPTCTEKLLCLRVVSFSRCARTESLIL